MEYVQCTMSLYGTVRYGTVLTSCEKRSIRLWALVCDDVMLLKQSPRRYQKIVFEYQTIVTKIHREFRTKILLIFIWGKRKTGIFPNHRNPKFQKLQFNIQFHFRRYTAVHTNITLGYPFCGYKGGTMPHNGIYLRRETSIN
jgi:hypothetical protein